MLDPARVWEEAVSLDTVGNAYFCRTIHTEPTGLRALEVYTNTFHMPRTTAIFDAVFALPSAAKVPSGYSISYVDVGDAGMASEAMEGRYEREAASLIGWRATLARKGFKTLGDLHAWLYSEHSAYAAGRVTAALPPPPPLPPHILATYADVKA